MYCYLIILTIVGNLLSSLMSSYDDVSDDGASDDHQTTEPSNIELDWQLASADRIAIS